MAAEGNTPDNFEPVEHYYHALLRHLGWENLGEVYAGGVMQIGDIAGHPSLEKAYSLGKSIWNGESIIGKRQPSQRRMYFYGINWGRSYFA